MTELENAFLESKGTIAPPPEEPPTEEATITDEAPAEDKEPPKQKKKHPVRTVLLCVLLAIILLPILTVAIALGPDLLLYAQGYAERDDGTLHFVKGHEYLVNRKGEFTVPSSFRGRKVSVIDGKAFENNKKLRHLTLEEGMVVVQSYAFWGCENLQTVTLPSTLQDIYHEVFVGCTSLETIQVHENNPYYTFDKDNGLLIYQGQTIVYYAAGNSQSSLTIPEGITGISTSAFTSANNLTALYIPRDVTLNPGAFSDCPNLTIYCEAEEYESTVKRDWNTDNIPVVYGYPLDEEDNP